MRIKNILVKEINQALMDNEFVLVYQPQIEVKSGKIKSMEALVRWNHPSRGVLSPVEFIPLAEKTKFIVPLGKWILASACRQLKEWQNKGFFNICMAVNISVIQLQQKDFYKALKDTLNEIELKPEFLEIEITESTRIKSIGSTIELLNMVRSLGVKVALDDFGTGYCSLNYLKSLPVDILKIDKSYTDEILNKYHSNIVEGIIMLGHKMKLQVVAEGVETKVQLDYLRDKRCDKIQGYFLSRPLSVVEMEKLLRKSVLI